MKKRDKIKGMVYFSLYGDALGFPHEFNFSLDKEVRLQKKEEFLRISDCQDPWACWSAFDEIPDNSLGILSDDSFYKLEIQIPFLCQYGHYSDELFARYCLEMMEQSCSPAMKAQLIDWLYMFDQINLPCDLIEDIRAKIKNKKQTQSFYDPKSSACFGLFLFHWQAITGRKSSTNFDSLEGQKISQLLFDHLTNAFHDKDEKILKKLEVYNPEYSKGVKTFHSIADLTNFSNLRSQLYKFRQNLPDEISSFKHDPAEFLICFSIAELLFSNDPLEGLKLICSSGGDADTIGSIWGSILGAKLGYDALLERYPMLEKEFSYIEDFSKSQSIDLSSSIDKLVSILKSDEISGR